MKWIEMQLELKTKGWDLGHLLGERDIFLGLLSFSSGCEVASGQPRIPSLSFLTWT